MKICIINPPNIFKQEEGFEWYPNIHTLPYLGIGYISSALGNAGYDVTAIDCPIQNISDSDLLQILSQNKYDIVGISVFYYNLKCVFKILNFFKKNTNPPFIFLGGYVPTLNYETLLHSNKMINCCVIGEGEQTIVGLAYMISHEQDWHLLEGIAYEFDGEIYYNPKRQYIDRLDELAFPYRYVSSYNVNSISILTTRGCYGNCSFCSEKEFAKRNGCTYVRYRSVDNVIKEIETLYEVKKFKNIRFVDSDFLDPSGFRKKWVKEFLSKIQSLKFNFKFSFNCRANDILSYTDILPEMHRLGCDMIFVGVESFVERQLDSFGKETSVQENLQALHELSKNNISIEMGMLFIEPFTSLEEFRDNLVMLFKSDFFNAVSISQHFISSSCYLTIIPGTKIYENIYNAQLDCDNELGYKFSDTRMEILYKLLGCLTTYTDVVSRKAYVIYKADYEGDSKRFYSYVDWYKKMLYIDAYNIFLVVEKMLNSTCDFETMKLYVSNLGETFTSISEKIFNLIGDIDEVV